MNNIVSASKARRHNRRRLAKEDSADIPSVQPTPESELKIVQTESKNRTALLANNEVNQLFRYNYYPGDITEQQRRLIQNIPLPFRKWLEGLRNPESLAEGWNSVVNMNRDQAVRNLIHCQSMIGSIEEPEDWVPHNSWSKASEVYTAYLITLLQQEQPSASVEEIGREIRYMTNTELVSEIC